jgi:hypothetical protein
MIMMVSGHIPALLFSLRRDNAFVTWRKLRKLYHLDFSTTRRISKFAPDTIIPPRHGNSRLLSSTNHHTVHTATVFGVSISHSVTFLTDSITEDSVNARDVRISHRPCIHGNTLRNLLLTFCMSDKLKRVTRSGDNVSVAENGRVVQASYILSNIGHRG